MSGAVRDLVLLMLMCLVLYCTGLDTHGVTNWQEAQRVVVAREMQRRMPSDADALLVPRHNGLPYIAKPPLIYWVTIALARLRGGEVELFDLRLGVALAGTLGVLGTYIVARGVLRPVGVRLPGDESHVAAARWAAVVLATGILYFRSARIGELDILMVPSVVGAVGCIWLAWRSHLERRAARPERGVAQWLGLRARWPAVIGAAVFGAAAALTKGPPSLMVILVAGYGAMVLAAAFRAEPRSARVGPIVGALGAAAFGVAGAVRAQGPADIPGVAMLALIGAGLGWLVSRLMSGRGILARLWLTLAHTHPVVVAGAPIVAFWLWGSHVSNAIGHDLAISLAREQAENDLNLFVPESPINNLEALVYGCGIGSVLAIAAAAWWLRFRPRPTSMRAGIMVPVAWVLLSVCMLSLFGKGVARYLTPVWPGVAIIAGAWLMRRRDPGERAGVPDPRLRGGLIAACALLGIGQAGWYALGREKLEHSRTPQALMRELLDTQGVDPARVASFEFYTPALDYYAGHYVQPIVTAQMGREVAGGEPWTIEELVTHVREGGPMIVLCRGRSLDASLPDPAVRLAAAGLDVGPVELRSRFVIDNGRSAVHAVRVGVP